MGKVIQYNPKKRPHRKLGFRKVHKSEELERKGQLNIFRTNDISGPTERDHTIIRSLPTHLSAFEKALLMDEKGDPKAEELYIEAIEESTSSPDAYCNLGVMYASKGASAKSIGAFTKALSIAPRHLESHYNLANIYFDSGNFELAIVHYQVALEIDPKFSEAWYNLALAFASSERYKNAFEAFLEYKKLNKSQGKDPEHGWFESLSHIDK